MLTLWGKEGYGWSPIVEAGKGVSTKASGFILVSESLPEIISASSKAVNCT
jgi:hypothetical protein